MATHAFTEDVEIGHHSKAMLSLETGVDKAIVFIHGFGGSALSTWEGFDSLLPHWVPNWDLYFYGYDSWAAQANAHAHEFERFLSRLGKPNSPGEPGNPLRLPASRRETTYETILVVAHSLGAIITRRALLNAWLRADEKRKRTSTDKNSQTTGWFEKVHMVLFAPAHLGATDCTDLLDAAVETLPSLGKLVSSLAPGANLGFLEPLGEIAGFGKTYGKVVGLKSLRDLQVSSITLSQLGEQTSEILEKEPSSTNFLVAKRVIFGIGEDIVDANRFGADPTADFWTTKVKGSRFVLGGDHIGICKPSLSFLEPVFAVRDVARSIAKTKDANLTVPHYCADEIIKLVPDPPRKSRNEEVGRREQLTVWLSNPELDVTLLDQYFVHHYRVVTPIPEKARPLRDGLDLLLDGICWLEVAATAGVVDWEKPHPVLDNWLGWIRNHRALVEYHTRLYPQPLVGELLNRLGPSTRPETQPSHDDYVLFKRLTSQFIRFTENRPLHKFRRLLEDFAVEPSVTWQALVPYLQSPKKFSAVLAHQVDTPLSLALQGYRAFLHFCLNLRTILNDSHNAAISKVVWRFYSYWLQLFHSKYSNYVLVSIRANDADGQNSLSARALELDKLLEDLGRGAPVC